MTRWVFPTLVVLLSAAGMGTVQPGCMNGKPESVSGHGTIVHLEFEGGFYGIIDEKGEHWDPSNLPEDFQVDSLRVAFLAKITDQPTFHMWGRTVDLLSISRLK